MDEQVANEDNDSQLEPEITLHALTGWTSPKTTRLAAKIGPQEVNVLIDSGSIHNCINHLITDLLCVLVIPTAPMNVRVANGKDLLCLRHI